MIAFEDAAGSAAESAGAASSADQTVHGVPGDSQGIGWWDWTWTIL